MAWEHKANGRRYFYKSRRRRDGTIARDYYGFGKRAEEEARRVERDKARRKKLAEERRLAADLEAASQDVFKSVKNLLEANYVSSGFHNPRGRGWRKRHMRNNSHENENSPDPNDSAPSNGPPTFEQVLARARRGDIQASLQVRKILRANPDALGDQLSLARKVVTNWMTRISGDDLVESEMLARSVVEQREKLLAEGGGSELERLAAEQVIASLLQLTYFDQLEARDYSGDIAIADLRSKQLERASRRHGRAIANLMTLRVMAPKMDPSLRNPKNVGPPPADTCIDVDCKPEEKAEPVKRRKNA